MEPRLAALRAHAISATLFKPSTLKEAVERLGFVQMDPIRSPAAAQDLILRHRVKGYRAGDLEREYHRLGFEEGRLYAHGIMPRSIWRLLHPKARRKLTSLEKLVLEIAAAGTRIHPDDLVVHLGRKTAINAWGTKSRATTLALESLHFHGLLRVAGRRHGQRIYELPSHKDDQPAPAERFRRLALAVASVLGPLSEKSLATALGFMAYGAPALKGVRALVPKLIESGELAAACVDDVRYVWPADRQNRRTPQCGVRFLAPFDPLVWDRQRFDHFWGWQYRFEAYTPAAKRVLGYYAMPMLWRDDVIGWVNAAFKNGKLAVERGFKKAVPKEPSFEPEYEAEVARLEMFLRKRRHSPAATSASAAISYSADPAAPKLAARCPSCA